MSESGDGKSALEGGEVSFRFNGRRIGARPGDTIAASLYRSGVRIFSRSVKYHRPRGLLCVAGHCTACMVEVDGLANVRACTASARSCRVRTQNVFPSAEWDLFSATDYAYPRHFEYQRRFLRPPLLNRIFYVGVRRMAGVGRFRVDPRPPEPRQLDSATTGVLVIGGGAAGLAAAAAARRTGVEALLVHSGNSLGGGATYGSSSADARRALVDSLPRDLPSWHTATALGYYDGLVLVGHGGRLVEIRPEATVVAVGGHELMPLFPNSDLPGVVTTRVVRYLWGRFRIKPGSRAVVDVGPGGDASVLTELESAGTEIVETIRTDTETREGEHSVVRAHGFTKLKAVTVARGGTRRRLKCDLYVYAHGARPAPELFQQAGCRMKYSETLGGQVPEMDAEGRTTNARVFGCGLAAGYTEFDECVKSGELAGASAARAARSAYTPSSPATRGGGGP